MYSMTIEICVDEQDPTDRTLGVLVRTERSLEMARSLRIAPQRRIGDVLVEIDRLVLAWALPELRGDASEHLHDVWDSCEQHLMPGPF